MASGDSSSSVFRLSAPAGVIDFNDSRDTDIVHSLVRMRLILNPYCNNGFLMCCPQILAFISEDFEGVQEVNCSQVG